jgi:hypothetical protein
VILSSLESRLSTSVEDYVALSVPLRGAVPHDTVHTPLRTFVHLPFRQLTGVVDVRREEAVVLGGRHCHVVEVHLLLDQEECARQEERKDPSLSLSLPLPSIRRLMPLVVCDGAWAKRQWEKKRNS